MNPILAVIVTSFVLVQPVFAAEPPSRPVGPAGQGAIVGFQEEPDTFEVSSPKGKFQVVIERSGRDARKVLHASRSKDMYGGKSLEAVQREFGGQGGTNGASVFIGFTDDGNLVGTLKDAGGNPRQVRFYAYGLNDEGTTRTVVMSGGRLDGEPALFVKLITSAGTETSRIVLTAMNTIVLSM